MPMLLSMTYFINIINIIHPELYTKMEEGTDSSKKGLAAELAVIEEAWYGPGIYHAAGSQAAGEMHPKKQL